MIGRWGGINSFLVGLLRFAGDIRMKRSQQLGEQCEKQLPEASRATPGSHCLSQGSTGFAIGRVCDRPGLRRAVLRRPIAD